MIQKSTFLSLAGFMFFFQTSAGSNEKNPTNSATIGPHFLLGPRPDPGRGRLRTRPAGEFSWWFQAI